MNASIPEVEPTEFTAGDTVKWKIYTSDYLPDDGWVMSYVFVDDDEQHTITGTDNGDGYHLITIDTTTSATFSPGYFRWQSYVSKDAERYTIGRGEIEVKADFATATTGYDSRSHVKKVLDAIESLIEGKASKDQESWSVEGRALSRYSWPDLLKLRDKYLRYYREEQAAERIARGLDGGRKIVVRG